MASKRPHTKSRTGCRQCKTRRIKCNGSPPSCNNCTSRGLSCEYQSLQGAVDALQFMIRSNSEPQPLPAPPSFSLADLGLMHHYLTNTCWTIGPAFRDHSAWQVDVPHLALSHQFLLHALLGLAAAHRISEQPMSVGPGDREQARNHYASALRLFRESFGSARLHEVAPVFRSFNAMIGILFLYWECEQAYDQNPIDAFASLLMLLQKSQDIILNHQQEPFKDCPTTIFQPRRASDPDGQFVFPDGFEHALEQLKSDYAKSASDLSPEEVVSIEKAFVALRVLHSVNVTAPKTGEDIMRWILSLDCTFVGLLRRRELTSLCILVFWCVPFGNLPYKWYTGEWPRRLLSALISEVATTGWYAHFRWPLSESAICKERAQILPRDA